MAKDEQSNQLNLTVVALVALVAIVGLVALVMNAASISELPRGSQIVSAEDNAAGLATGDAQIDMCAAYAKYVPRDNWGTWAKTRCI